MNFLLLDTLSEYLLVPTRIAGLVLISLGITTILVAKKLTRVIKKQSVIDKGDKTYVGILTGALIAILAGMIIAILEF